MKNRGLLKKANLSKTLKTETYQNSNNNYNNINNTINNDKMPGRNLFYVISLHNFLQISILVFL